MPGRCGSWVVVGCSAREQHVADLELLHRRHLDLLADLWVRLADLQDDECLDSRRQTALDGPQLAVRLAGPAALAPAHIHAVADALESLQIAVAVRGDGVLHALPDRVDHGMQAGVERLAVLEIVDHRGGHGAQVDHPEDAVALGNSLGAQAKAAQQPQDFPADRPLDRPGRRHVRPAAPRSE